MKYLIFLGLLWITDYAVASNHMYCVDQGSRIVCYDNRTGQKTIIMKG